MSQGTDETTEATIAFRPKTRYARFQTVTDRNLYPARAASGVAVHAGIHRFWQILTLVQDIASKGFLWQPLAREKSS